MEEYLERGPGFLFLFHPALGPLWDIIAQKIRGGALAPGAELVLEARVPPAPSPVSSQPPIACCTPAAARGVGWFLRQRAVESACVCCSWYSEEGVMSALPLCCVFNAAEAAPVNVRVDGSWVMICNATSMEQVGMSLLGDTTGANTALTDMRMEGSLPVHAAAGQY